MHLPQGLSTNCSLAAVAFAERASSKSLRIAVAADNVELPQLFVRILATNGKTPVVRSIDAMVQAGRKWLCETLEPSNFDFGTHRIELVDRLAAPVLNSERQTFRRDQQWVLLAMNSASSSSHRRSYMTG